MHLGISSTIAVTLAIILFSFVFAEFLPGFFGVKQTESVYAEATFAIRIFMPFTVFLGVTLMFSNYYIYIERLNLGATIKFLLLLILPSVGMFAGMFGLHFMWLGVGISFIVALIVNKFLTRNKFGMLLIDGQKFSRQLSFDTTNSPENLPALTSKAEKFFTHMHFDDGRKNFLLNALAEVFNAYSARKKTLAMEISVIPAAESTTVIFRDNGAPENPIPKLAGILDNVREKNYMISGDENKFVVVL